MAEKIDFLEQQHLPMADALPVIPAVSAYSILRAARLGFLGTTLNLTDAFALKSKAKDAPPSKIAGKIRKIGQYGEFLKITLEDYFERTHVFLYVPQSRPINFSVGSDVLFAELTQEQPGLFPRLLGKANTTPMIAHRADLIITKEERNFLAANRLAETVIAVPIRQTTDGRVTEALCEPIAGRPAIIRYYNDGTNHKPSIGKPFIAAVTHSNGQQYISVGSNSCIPLATDIAPHIFY